MARGELVAGGRSVGGHCSTSTTTTSVAWRHSKLCDSRYAAAQHYAVLPLLPSQIGLTGIGWATISHYTTLHNATRRGINANDA